LVTKQKKTEIKMVESGRKNYRLIFILCLLKYYADILVDPSKKSFHYRAYMILFYQLMYCILMQIIVLCLPRYMAT
jgi:hypothetical protein